MSGPDDGGPAFPRAAHIAHDHRICDSGDVGMTLRDYFAGQALIGLLQRGTITEMGLLAEKAWGAADWMLNERAKGRA